MAKRQIIPVKPPRSRPIDITGYCSSCRKRTAHGPELDLEFTETSVTVYDVCKVCASRNRINTFSPDR